MMDALVHFMQVIVFSGFIIFVILLFSSFSPSVSTLICFKLFFCVGTVNL